MADFSSPPTDVTAPLLLDVTEVASLLTCSARHVYRMSGTGAMPPPVRLGTLVRWPKQTGNPMTGILDWTAAGCPIVKGN